MGVFDKAKAAAEELGGKVKVVATDAKGKIGELATEHGTKVTGAVDKATDFVDTKTGGKLAPVTSKVDSLTDKAVTSAQGLAPESPEQTDETDGAPGEDKS